MFHQTALQVTTVGSFDGCINKTLHAENNSVECKNGQIDIWIDDVYKLLTSRPAMQWKKNSCGRIPVKKRPETKPPARGDVS